MRFRDYIKEEEINEFSAESLRKTIKKARPAQLEKIRAMISDLVDGDMISKEDAASLRSLISSRM